MGEDIVIVVVADAIVFQVDSNAEESNVVVCISMDEAQRDTPKSTVPQNRMYPNLHGQSMVDLVDIRRGFRANKNPRSDGEGMR